MKLFALASLLAGTALVQAPSTLSIRVAGSDAEVMGSVVGGKDMVPLVDLAKLMGAQLDVRKATPTDRIATLTLATPKPAFDDGADTVLPVDGDTSNWITISNSDGKLRVRDFVRAKESWVMQGELDVAKGGITIQGRPPRDTMSLTFYVVFKDATGKTLGRRNMEIKGVSYDGGRYPIAINLSRGDGSSALPATVGFRFNSAQEDERSGGGQ